MKSDSIEGGKLQFLYGDLYVCRNIIKSHVVGVVGNITVVITGENTEVTYFCLISLKFFALILSTMKSGFGPWNLTF